MCHHDYGKLIYTTISKLTKIINLLVYIMLSEVHVIVIIMKCFHALHKSFKSSKLSFFVSVSDLVLVLLLSDLSLYFGQHLCKAFFGGVV